MILHPRARHEKRGRRQGEPPAALDQPAKGSSVPRAVAAGKECRGFTFFASSSSRISRISQKAACVLRRVSAFDVSWRMSEVADDKIRKQKAGKSASCGLPAMN